MQSVTLVVFATLLALSLAKSAHESSDESSADISEDYSEEYSDTENECIDELNLKDENGGINTKSPNYECYQRCLYLKDELINDEGEPIIEYFPANMRPIVSTCNDKNKSKQKCERESSFNTCYESESQLYYSQIFDECANETNFKFSTKGEPDDSNNEGMACVDMCMLKKEGVVTNNNEIDVDGFTQMAKYIENVDIKEVIQRCKEENMGKSKCAAVVKTSECIASAIYEAESAESGESDASSEPDESEELDE